MRVYAPDESIRGRLLTYGHLRAEDISPQAPPVIYLGWPLYLSPVEHTLLVTLLRAAVEADASDGGWVSPALLGRAAAQPDSSGDGRLGGIPEGQVAVHVLRINRKAAEIGGRRLIVSHKGKGYRITPYM